MKDLVEKPGQQGPAKALWKLTIAIHSYLGDGMWDVDRLLQAGGCACLSIGGISYTLAALSGGDLKELQRVTPIKSLADLQKFIGRKPTPVAVRGRVASETPIKSEFTNAEAVYALHLEEQVSKSRLNGNWKTDKNLLLREARREAPWCLRDSNGDGVVVERIGRLESFPILQFTGLRMHPAENGLLSSALATVSGYMPAGTEEKEWILPLNQELTAIGEVVSLAGEAEPSLSNNPSEQAQPGMSSGNVHGRPSEPRLLIRAPPGGHLKLSCLTFEEQIATLENISRGLHKAAVICGVSGALLLGVYFARKGFKALKRWNQRKHEKKFLSSLAARRAAAAQALGQQPADPNAEGVVGASSSSRTEWSCPICFMEEGCTPCFFLCGHVVCEQCINQGRMTRCPVCRMASQPRKLYMT